MNNRVRTLLRKAQESFKNGISGLSQSFLIDNNVTFEESQMLQNIIASALDDYISWRTPPHNVDEFYKE